MLERINLRLELLKERERIRQSQERLIDEVKDVLLRAHEYEEKLQERIRKSSDIASEDFNNLKPENIFSLPEIRNICTRYRLRFLETRYLRHPLPYEAFIHIKEFEKKQQTEIKQFSILAPAEAFRLDKKTDPLLFAHLGNDRYYLLHQWGNDLSAFRKVIMFPLRNFYTLLATIIITSFAIAFLVPKEWIVYDEHLYPMMYNFRMFLFFLLTTGSMATVFYIGITRNKELSEEAWNSKWI